MKASQGNHFHPRPNTQRFRCAGACATLIGAVILAGLLQSEAATRYVSLSGAHVSPFESWDQAATNIQAAIDVAVVGDEVLVTNGVYATGGKVMAGDLTNRIAIDKAITVRSVNGAQVTEIRGSGGINGPEAVRCAWLKNGAVLSGFTLARGATRASGNLYTMEGGGIWCEGSGALIKDCFITSNSAQSRGAGACQGNYLRCRIFRNNCFGTGSEGGGIYSGTANNSEIFENSAKAWGGGLSRTSATNCAIYRNLSQSNGGGAYSGILTYCTVTGNTGITAGGVYNCAAINSIIYGNHRENYTLGTFHYSCSVPLPGGNGNIGSDPRVLSDLFHIAEDSPCRGAGTNISVITSDLEGHARQNPPTIGCDEWRQEPMASIDSTPKVSTSPLRLGLVSAVAGEEPIVSYWLKSGQPLVDDPRYGIVPGQGLFITNLTSADKGDYQLVASNAFGVFTSAVVRVDFYCVDASCPNPSYPYLTWETASANIQDAVDAAANGALILVTNGIYSSGGRVGTDGLTNRVVVPRPVTIASLNGAGSTIIQGARDPAAIIGPAAVRGLWLADGARIGGFTIEGGSTDDTYKSHGQGGGVFGNSTNAVLVDCILRNNWAHNGGGGASVTFDRCKLIENTATENGGGAQGAVVVNSIVRSNVALLFGGGGMSCRWFNSTIVENVAISGGGIHASRATNSIIYNNYSVPYKPSTANVGEGIPQISYSCTYPLPAGIGNISSDPQILDGQHLAATSPCIGAGNALFSTGTDLDQQPWANPPPMGCDQYVEADNVGPLDFTLGIADPNITESRNTRLYAAISGRANRVAWDFGDGSTLTNLSLVSVDHAWTNPGNYTITCTAYNLDHPAGVSKTIGVTVIPLVVPAISNPTWSTNAFTLGFQSQPGVTYQLQQTTNLAPPAVWTPAGSLVGDGAFRTLTDTTATNQMRFYRLWLQ